MSKIASKWIDEGIEYRFRVIGFDLTEQACFSNCPAFLGDLESYFKANPSDWKDMCARMSIDSMAEAKGGG
jgi:hypothetical protein